VAAQDYRDDNRISQEILTRVAEAYRRIRNTCRYILGNISDFDPAVDSVPFEKMPEIDRLALHVLEGLKERVLRAYEELEFHIIYQAVNAFCSVELSAIYLDILKDRLYTSRKDSLERRSAQTAFYLILDSLVRMVAPVLSFTADEVWWSMPGKREESVHLADFPALTPEVKDDALAARWVRLFSVRAEVLKALELARAQKTIGHPLDAAVAIAAPAEDRTFLEKHAAELKTIFIVSKVELVEEISGESYEPADLPGYRIAVTPAPGEKCERCWCYDEEIGADTDHPSICPRCVAAVK
jgi:isoleucyl-tRNA synthetase